MKSPVSPRGGKLSAGILACLCTFGSLLAADNSSSAIPRGTLNVDRDLVRVGTRSQLDWKIEYPSTTPVDVTPTGTIIPKSNVKMKVRVLGVAFQTAKSNNGHGNNADGVDSSNPGKGKGGPNGETDPSGEIDDEIKNNGNGSLIHLAVEAYWSLNGASWERFFHGFGPSVQPSAVLINRQVKKGDRIDFGGRGHGLSSWNPFHDTRSADNYVTVLKNGDSAPSYAPAYNQGNIVSFLAPYLDSGRKIKIGPRDLIILFELSTASPGSTYFDMQDLVLLVSFE